MKRGQSAMEFLMTYGWAIVVVLVVLSALFFLGVFNPKTVSTCNIQAPFVCKDIQIDEGGVTFLLGNLNVDSIDNVGIHVNGQPCDEILIDNLYATSANGIKNEQIKVECAGLNLNPNDKISTQINFTYVANSLEHTIEGTGSGQVEDGNSHVFGGVVLLLSMNGNADDSSTGEHGTTVFGNTNCNVQGKSGQGCYFDGSGDYIIVDHSEMSFNQNLTVSVWVNVTNLPAAYTYFIHSRNVEAGLAMGLQDTGVIFFSTGDTSFGGVGDGVFSENVWHHVVGTYNGTIRSIYVDGAFANSNDVSNQFSLSSDIRVGGLNTDGNFFEGVLDEMIVWNRSLTYDEVSSLYNSY